MTDLPDNWASIGLLEAAEFVRGVTYSKADARSAAFDGSIPVLRANNIQGRTFALQELVYVPHKAVSESQLVKIGDVVIATSSGSISVVGKAASAKSDMHVGFGAFCGLLRPTKEIDHGYFGHFFATDLYRRRVSELARGVNINNLKKDHFASLSIAIAPRSEQKRIADKLDALLARVDTCRERLDRVPAFLKRFRQSVLASATTGALTEDWRMDLGVFNESPRVSLREVAGQFSYGSAAKSSQKGEVPVLRMGNIQGGYLDWSDLVYTSDRLEIEKYRLSAGDVLFNRTNSPELVGKTAVFNGEHEAIYAGYLIRVRCSDCLRPDYLNFCLGSPAGRDYCWEVKSDGVSQSNINAQKLAAFEFSLPSLDEQTEIIRRVEMLFGFAAGIEARYQIARLKVDRLTPALLAKAFRGELVSQNPDDEPASALLDRIRSQRAPAPTAPRRDRLSTSRKSKQAKTT